MNIKQKQENKATKEQSRNKITEKAIKITGTLEQKVGKIGIRNKYSERIKTSYISIFLYLLLICLQQKVLETPGNEKQALALLFTGIIITIYNIIKSALSIKDKERKTHNIILIVLQSLFMLFFIGLIFY